MAQTQTVLPRRLPVVSWDSRTGRFRIGEDNPAWAVVRARYNQLLLQTPSPVQYLRTSWAQRLRRARRELSRAADVFFGRRV